MLPPLSPTAVDPDKFRRLRHVVVELATQGTIMWDRSVPPTFEPRGLWEMHVSEDRMDPRHTWVLYGTSQEDPETNVYITNGQYEAVRKQEGEGFAASVYHFFTGKYQGEKALEKFLHTHGEQRIQSIRLFRQPVGGALQKIVNWFTKGDLEAQMGKNSYDKLFHLSMYIELSGGASVTIEKNSAFTTHIGKLQYGVEAQSLVVPMNAHPEMREFIYKAIQRAGAKDFFVYDAFSKNCQDFVYNALQANGLLTPDVADWIRQNLLDVAQKHPAAAKFFTAITDLHGIVTGGGVGRVRLNGRKVHRPHAPAPVSAADALELANFAIDFVQDPVLASITKGVEVAAQTYKGMQTREQAKAEEGRRQRAELQAKRDAELQAKMAWREGQAKRDAVLKETIKAQVAKRDAELQAKPEAQGVGLPAHGTTSEDLSAHLHGLRGFRGVFSADTLPKTLKTHESLITNLQNASEGGSHWVCLAHLGGGQIFYYDPYGGNPDDRVLALIHRSKATPVRNTSQYQSPSSVACGPYCVFALQALEGGRAGKDGLYTLLFETLQPDQFKKNEKIIMSHY
jgi:hypothetical protein